LFAGGDAPVDTKEPRFQTKEFVMIRYLRNHGHSFVSGLILALALFGLAVCVVQAQLVPGVR
jgi:hypothetical protein